MSRAGDIGGGSLCLPITSQFKWTWHFRVVPQGSWLDSVHTESRYLCTHSLICGFIRLQWSLDSFVFHSSLLDFVFYTTVLICCPSQIILGDKFCSVINPRPFCAIEDQGGFDLLMPSGPLPPNENWHENWLGTVQGWWFITLRHEVSSVINHIPIERNSVTFLDNVCMGAMCWHG